MEKKHALAVSLCITVFNEEKHIHRLLDSITAQTRQPDEVVIVDGGSTDQTITRITNHESRIKNLKVLTKKGNRAIGRNEAIQQASGNIIAITDAGCELDKQWLEEITKPFHDSTTQVVSGYYAGRPKNVLEASFVPYVLVMPDRVNPALFLPSTRSMAMRKSVWAKLGGFPVQYRWNEDYVFSKTLEKRGISIVFAKKAIVYWFPRETVWEGWEMFYAFAKGDAQAGIWRPKVIFLLFRAVAVICLAIFAFTMNSSGIWGVLGGLWVVYMAWAVYKNYHYVENPWAILYLPMWQVISDSAVLAGTIVGAFKK